MSSSYLKKIDSYDTRTNYKHFGVISPDNQLVSYCDIGFFGEFVLVNRLLGHKDFLNDGVMYLMMIEVSKLMFDHKNDGYNFVMYDTFFGASKGLKMFKEKLGYKPYRVKWKWGK